MTIWLEIGKQLKLKEAIQGEIISRLLNLIISAFSEEGKALDGIRADLRNIIAAHLKNGKNYLQDAIRTTDQVRRELRIEEARSELIRASNIDAPPADAEAALLVAGCFHLLKERDNEIRLIGEAYEKAFAWHRTLGVAVWSASTSWTGVIEGWAAPAHALWAQERDSDRLVKMTIAHLQEIEELLRPLSDLLYSSGSKTRNLESSNKFQYDHSVFTYNRRLVEANRNKWPNLGYHRFSWQGN